jgi:hypothetical protein
MHLWNLLWRLLVLLLVVVAIYIKIDEAAHEKYANLAGQLLSR